MSMQGFFRVIISGACIAAAASSGFGQAQPAAAPLSWSECVSRAVRNNPSLAANRYALRAGRSSYYGSYNGVLPQVNLSQSYSDSTNSTGSTSTGSDNWQTVGSVSLSLFNRSNYASISASRAQLAQTEASAAQASALVRFNLSKAFYQLLFAQKNAEVSQNIVKMRDEEAQLVTLRYNSGTEYKGNMLRAKAQFLQAKADLEQARRDIRIAQRALNQQLGYDEFTAVSVTGTFTIPEAAELPQDEEALLRGRHDVIRQQAAIRGAEASLSQSKSSLWPTLSANYSLSSRGESGFTSPRSGWGVSLNYPLFGGGPTASYFAAQAARNNVERAKQELRSVREQALMEIETAWSNFGQAVDRSKVAEALLEAARTRNEEANIRYNSGLLTYDGWEIITSDRISQERQTIQARMNALTAEAAWANALGKQIEE